jgi:hypothetical protein
MANTILGLAMKVTADASSVPKSLTQAERAFERLGQQVERSTAVFAPFTERSAAAAAEQERFAERFARLADQLQSKAIGPQEYAAAFAQLTQEAKAASEAFAEGVRIQKQYGDQTRVVAEEIARLVELEKLGAIDATALNNAAIEKLGIDKQAAASAKARADAVSAAEKQQAEAFAEARRLEEQAAAQANRARANLEDEAEAIRQRNLTAQERFDKAVQRANVLEQAGVLQKEDYNRELNRQADLFAQATIAANRSGQAIQQAGDAGVLKFRELSGVLAVLPGPIGNLAGRLSGLASAGEGLGRVFAGGLQTGIANIGASVAGLINPFTAGAAAFAALGAGAVAAGRNLIQLEGEVERLGQLADRVGVSFSFIQVLEAAALQTGTSVEQLGGGFTRFLRAVNEARDGTKSAVEAFKNLRISTDAVRDGNPETLFQQAAQALAQMPDPAQRTATAMALFGKSGAELLPVIGQLGAAAADLERLGGALTDQQRADIDAFGGAMDRVGVASQGLYRQITANFAGIGTAIANSTAESLGGINRLIRALDDTASDRTFLGFQKTQARLQADAELLKRRNEAIQESQRLASNQTFADFVASLNQSIDGAINLSGEIGKAQEQAAAFGSEGSKAVESLVKSLEDVAAAAEDAGLSQEQLAAAQKNAFADFSKRIEAIKEEADVRRQAAEDSRRATEQENAAAAKAVETVRAQLNVAIEDSARFGQAGFDAALKYQRAIEQLEQQFGRRIINEATLRQNAAAANAEYQKQVEAFTKIEELQRSIAAADKQRLDQIVAAQNETKQGETDLEFVLRQQRQLVEEIADARRNGAVIAADAAAARLAQLDQIEAKLLDQEQAVEQGFTEGFAKAFEQTDKELQGLIAQAEKFGNVGALAFDALQKSVERTKAQTRDQGLFTDATYQQEVERQKELFNQQLQGAQRVEDFLAARLDDRQRAEFDAAAKLEERKKEAALNVKAIEDQIAKEREAVEAARKGGNLADARAGVQRLNQLNQAKRAEQQIANGRQQANRQQLRQIQQGNTPAQQFQSLIARNNDLFLSGIQNAYAGANAALAQSAQFASQQAERVRRFEEMSRPTNAAAQTADFRTAEGQALVQSVAEQAQDPALIEARLQTKQLNRIAAGITQAAANYFNSPVAIVGGARMG